MVISAKKTKYWSLAAAGMPIFPIEIALISNGTSSEPTSPIIIFVRLMVEM